MSMTSRELIRSVLTFGRPPRIGMTLPPPYPNDMLWAARKPSPNQPLTPCGSELRRWRDEWGCVWASLTAFDKGEVVEGAITDWSQLETYTPPALGDEADYREVARIFKSDTEHFRVGFIPGFTFNIARKIRRLESYLCDLVTERENIDRLHRLVRTELLKAIDRFAEAGADAIFFTEDWGTQDRLMVSPEMWREIFRPEFLALAGRAHDHGLSVLMHSCGKMTAIIEDLIACGVNCLQFDQPRLHGIDLLAKRFAGRVAFWCPVDIQETLQTRDPARIREDARLYIEKLGAPNGGFIAGYYSSNEAIGITADIQEIACKAFVEYGTPKHPAQ